MGALSPLMVTRGLCSTQGSGMTPLRALTETHPRDTFLHPASVHQPRAMGTTRLLSVQGHILKRHQQQFWCQHRFLEGRVGAGC